MNPVFVLLVILASVAVWFLLSFAFIPIGKLFCQIWQDAADEINKNDESEEREE